MRVRMRTAVARRVRELREKDPLIEHTLKELETIPIMKLCAMFLENIHIPFQNRW
jgi:hypothetical protein